MSSKQIKISIGGRNYPLTVESKEEKAVFEAEKMIQQNIDKLKSAYNISDSRDLLAMTALEFATRLNNEPSANISDADRKILEDIAQVLKSV